MTRAATQRRPAKRPVRLRTKVKRARYDNKTTRLADLLVQMPGQTSRFYGERCGMTRLVCGKMLCRLRDRGLAEGRELDTRLLNARRWYPTPALVERATSGRIVDTQQVQILNLLADSPWLFQAEIATALSIPLSSVQAAIRMLFLRGEVKPHARYALNRSFAWAVADEDAPFVRAEAS